MAFKFGDVTRNLVTKGFVRDSSGHHLHLHFYRDGKQTRFYTYVSHGKQDQDMGDDLIHAMKRQLGLSTMKQVRALIECTMGEREYLCTLIQSGQLSANPPADEPSKSRHLQKNKTARKK